MRRSQLEQLLRDLARISHDELVIVGSQSIHALTEEVPPEVVMSVEVDVLIEDDELEKRIDARLGPTSEYQAEHGVYVDTVSASFPFLPPGWEQRLRRMDLGGASWRCIDVCDLAMSKLVAGRLKDNEMIAALVAYELLDIGKLRERIASIADLHMRAILLARLQIVLENVGT
jgi:hypothetical protein